MKNASRIFKGPLIWILLCIGLIIVFLQFAGSGNGYKAVSYTHLTLPTTPYV